MYIATRLRLRFQGGGVQFPMVRTQDHNDARELVMGIGCCFGQTKAYGTDAQGLRCLEEVLHAYLAAGWL